MTTIFTCKEGLYGDHCTITSSQPGDSSTLSSKIFKSKCGRFAYGVCGSIAVGEALDLLEDKIRVALENYHQSDDKLNYFVNSELNIDKTLVITSDYTLQCYGKSNSFRMDSKSFCSMGTGMELATHALANGVVASEVIPLISTIDELTSESFDFISREDLANDWIVEEVA